MVWTPYRHLVYYTYGRIQSRTPKFDAVRLRARVQKQSEELATQIAEATHDASRLADGEVWPQVSDAGPIPARGFSEALQALVNTGHHKHRQILEELALFYARAGWRRKEALERIYEEYRSLEGEACMLTPEDISYFIRYFWDWFSISYTELQAQRAYVDEHLAGTTYDQIVLGVRTIDHIRSDYRLFVHYNSVEAAKRRAFLASGIAERGFQHIANKVHRNDLGGIDKILASITMASDSALKHDLFLQEVSGAGSGTAETLAQYIEEEVQERNFTTNALNWQDFDGPSVEDLRAENQSLPKMPDEAEFNADQQ
jgi:hypothetical protein